MAVGSNIRTYFNGAWHDGNVAVMRAADHGSWLGSTVFDGARFFDGVMPDLEAHCARVNRSAEALMITPTVSTQDMVAIVREGLAAFEATSAVYIRPMYWGIDGDPTAIVPSLEATGFAICLEEIGMAPAAKTVRLTRTKFRRPVLEDAVVNAKAGCLYPNNARMLVEARSRGFDNALVADAMGNVAETATANIFMVKDGRSVSLTEHSIRSAQSRAACARCIGIGLCRRRCDAFGTGSSLFARYRAGSAWDCARRYCRRD
jgi:branched-chain amino acid aminotransferase